MARATEFVFIKSAVVLLWLTAMAKLFSAGGSAPLLGQSDPIFMISNRVLLTGVGTIELLVAATLQLHKNVRVKLLALAWLSANFFIYRFGLWFLEVKQPCSCLGTAANFLPLDPATLNWMLRLIIVYFFVGSLLLLVRGKPEIPAYPGQLSSVGG